MKTLCRSVKMLIRANKGNLALFYRPRLFYQHPPVNHIDPDGVKMRPSTSKLSLGDRKRRESVAGEGGLKRDSCSRTVSQQQSRYTQIPGCAARLATLSKQTKRLCAVWCYVNRRVRLSSSKSGSAYDKHLPLGPVRSLSVVAGLLPKVAGVALHNGAIGWAVRCYQRSPTGEVKPIRAARSRLRAANSWPSEDISARVRVGVTEDHAGRFLQSQFVCKHSCVQCMDAVSVSGRTGFEEWSKHTLSPFRAFCCDTGLWSWLICILCFWKALPDKEKLNVVIVNVQTTLFDVDRLAEHATNYTLYWRCALPI